MNDSGVDEAAPIRIDEHAGECRSFAVTEVDEFPADPAGTRGGPTRSQLLGHLLLRVAPRDFTPRSAMTVHLAAAVDGSPWPGAPSRCSAARGVLEEEAVADGVLDEGIQVPQSGPRPPARRSARRCAFVEGFSLHADTWLHDNDVVGLERLCNYGARGPLSLERLSALSDGRLPTG
jgi:hypothetical protein